MKKIILLLFLFLSIPFFSNSQISELNFYKKMDSLNKEMIYYQFKNDSLKNITIDNLEKNSEEKDKQLRHNRIKTLILSVGLVISIIVISFIQ